MSEETTPQFETRSILPLYESIPEGDGPFPTIIHFMHAHGIDDSTKKICNDLAAEGYYTVAMDSYLNGKYSFKSRNDKLMFDTYDVTYHWLKQNPIADLNRVGLIGFCMGGRHSYLANAIYDHHKAVVSYYGFPHRGGDDESTPQNRIDDFTAPVLSIFGSEDQGIPLDAVENYREKTTYSDLDHKSIVYEGSGHGFLNHNSRNFDPEASKKAWSETIEFFNLHLQ